MQEFPFGNAWATQHGLVPFSRPPAAADLQAVSDRLAITETIQAYAWSVDEHRMDVFSDLFCADATFEIVIAGTGPVECPTGRDAITKWMSDYMDAIQFQMRHRMGNVLVTEQRRERASAISYLLLTATTPEQVAPMATACYAWTLVHEGDAWRISAVSAAFDRTFS